MAGDQYFYELFERLPRCGPGETAATARAFGLMAPVSRRPFILDIGCGTGAQTLDLASFTDGIILALDNHQPFLDRVMERAGERGLADRISVRNQSMDAMDFPDETFDIIWSEGALYSMGFEAGLRRCHELVKSGGSVAVTEAVYLVPDPPPSVVQFWNEEYPAITPITEKIICAEHAGFTLVGHFTLPGTAWWENFYQPMERELSLLRKRYNANPAALALFKKVEAEIDLYREHSDCFGYEFFVLRK